MKWRIALKTMMAVAVVAKLNVIGTHTQRLQCGRVRRSISNRIS